MKTFLKPTQTQHALFFRLNWLNSAYLIQAKEVIQFQKGFLKMYKPTEMISYMILSHLVITILSKPLGYNDIFQSEEDKMEDPEFTRFEAFNCNRQQENTGVTQFSLNEPTHCNDTDGSA